MPNKVHPVHRAIPIPEPIRKERKILFDPETGELAVRAPSEQDRDAIVVDAIATEGFFGASESEPASSSRKGPVSA